MKKLLSVILTFVFLLSVFSFGMTVNAQTEYKDGHYTYTVSNGEAAITYVAQSLVGDITVPSTLGGYPVTSIGEYCFFGFDDITSLTIGNTVKSIGEFAFGNCDKLENIVIGENVVIIGNYSLTDCPNLKSVIIPKNVGFVGDEVFFGCKTLTTIDVLENNEYYSSQDGILFNKDKTKLMRYPEGIKNVDYIVPEGVETIGNSAFHQCEFLKSVTLPSSIVNLENSAFGWCHNLTTVNIPDGIKKIGDFSFYDCNSLNNINLGNHVEYIGDETFSYCVSLKNITIPNTVESIGKCAFMYCRGLSSITIPDNVKSIGADAFLYCDAIEAVILPSNILSIGIGAFDACEKLNNVFYTGSSSNRKNISIGIYNEMLENAVWHYGSKGHGNYNTITVKTKATLTANGSIDTKCSVCGSVWESTKISKIKSVKVPSKITYNGKKKTPTVTVKDAKGKSLKKNKDYTVTYAKGRKKFGKYKVTVKFKGDYSGQKVLNFEIVPQKTKISKITAAKKSLKVTVKRQKKNVSGYQIQYSLKKSFKSAKTVTLKKNTITSKTIKKLKPKKTYYVRVRTYKTVKGKRYYSDWSKAAKKKTK